MSAIENSKLAVIGAGSVGTSLAYAALIRGSARHVALYDIAKEKVDAEVLDLAHGTQFTGSSDIVGGDDISVVAVPLNKNDSLIASPIERARPRARRPITGSRPRNCRWPSS